MRLLHRRKEELAALDPDVLARDVDRLAGEQRLVRLHELARHLVALGMGEKDAVAGVLDRVAAGDDVDEEPPVGQPVERRRHPRRERRRLEAGANGDKEAEAFRLRHHRRGDKPRVLAALAGREKHPVVAEPVGGRGDLAEVAEIGGAAADCRAEVPAVPMGRQEPQHADAAGEIGRGVHDCGALTASAILIACGIRPRSKKTSAIFCCSATTALSIGLTP